MLKVAHRNQKLKINSEQNFQVHRDPIFVDEAVHMLMIILIVFDRDDKEEVIRKVHDVALDMLYRHLRNQWGLSISYSKVKRVLECVEDLPKILTAFAAIF